MIQKNKRPLVNTAHAHADSENVDINLKLIRYMRILAFKPKFPKSAA